MKQEILELEKQLEAIDTVLGGASPPKPQVKQDTAKPSRKKNTATNQDKHWALKETNNKRQNVYSTRTSHPLKGYEAT